MPVYLAKAGGFFFMVFGATALIAALVTINPIWMYGPYEPSAASAGSQPDWYMGFAEGALSLMPSWEFTALGHTLAFNVLVPGVLLIPVLYGIAMVYPFLERWVIGDQGEQHVLDRPRDAATRTGLGVMALTFYLVLFVAGADDIIADRLHLSFEDLVLTFRVLLLVAPPAAFWVAKRVCLGLQRRDRDLVLHGRETGRLVREGHGRFFEAHEPLPTVTSDGRSSAVPPALRVAGPGRPTSGTPLVPEPAAWPAGRVLPRRPDRPSHPGGGRKVGRREHAGSAFSERPDWDGALHGGADERPVADAYARYGASAERGGRRRGSARGTVQRKPTSVAASGSAGVLGHPSPRVLARPGRGRAGAPPARRRTGRSARSAPAAAPGRCRGPSVRSRRRPGRGSRRSPAAAPRRQAPVVGGALPRWQRPGSPAAAAGRAAGRAPGSPSSGR